jgi:hypothetical protein
MTVTWILLGALVGAILLAGGGPKMSDEACTGNCLACPFACHAEEETEVNSDVRET